MQPGEVLNLIRSLNGFKQSPCNLFQNIKYKLEGIGFESIKSVDPCLFIYDKIVCLMYVDNKLLFSLEEKYIDKAIKNISYAELEIKVDD